jgi:ANTAR domain
MADRVVSGGAVPLLAPGDLDAFFRHRDDVPEVSPVRLISALGLVRGSDDPIVTFAGLARASVPEFADACQVELSDGAQPPFRVRHPVGPADDQGPADAQAAGPDQVLLTPFRVVPRVGYGSYAGVVSHWWAGRAPSESDAVLADLMVKHCTALVEQERLLVAVGRAEDRAASLALESISGRAISLATGIVMHQRGLSPDEAEEVLRQAAMVAGVALSGMAARVVRSRSLAGLETSGAQPVTDRHPDLAPPGQRARTTVSEIRQSAAGGRPRR